MNQQQTKHLRERLNRASRKVNCYRENIGQMPPEVKKAKAIIAAWDKKNEAINDARRDKLNAAVAMVEEAIFFGDPAKALAALKKFEAMKF